MMTHTRRDFLRATLGASSLLPFGATVPGVFADAVEAGGTSSGDNETILVVIQLSGGNDGLNTVVPYADDEYGRNRTTLRLPANQLHRIDASLGFHPRMGAFARLYKEGYLSIIQGVGYAHPDQSHDRAMRIWHTADPQKPERQTGWLGRVADHVRNGGEADTSAVFVGRIDRPFALNAERAIVPCIRSVRDVMPRDSGAEVDTDKNTAADDGLLRFMRQSVARARAKGEQIRTAANAAAVSNDYPPLGLASDLRTIAQIIRADVGVRVFFARVGRGRHRWL